MEEALRSFGRPCTSQEFLKKFPGYSVSELQGSGDVMKKTIDSVTFYWPVNKKPELRDAVAVLDQQINELEKDGTTEALKKHIQILHDYNDIKDATQSVLGKLAEIEQVTTKKMHTKYGLTADD